MSNWYNGYSFKGSIAYTEDDIPVKRLYFSKVPPQMTEDTLKAYFQSFGNILEWRVGKDPNNMCEWLSGDGMFSSVDDTERALVNYIHSLEGKDLKKTETMLIPCLRGEVLYATADNAARVLKCHPEHIENYFFEVEPSYSWRQPYAYGTPTEQEQEAAPILSLPDDYWAHILKFLDLRDKVRFARTCQRFREVYQIVTTKSCKTINSDQLRSMTRWDTRDFFQLTGDKVQDLECNLRSKTKFIDEVLAMIAGYCRNLISFSLKINVLTKDIMLKMSTSIVKLDLSDCDQIDDLALICKHFLNLRELSCYVSDFPKKVWLDIVKENYCPSLEVFHINAEKDIDCQILAQLPNLKSVTIDASFDSFGNSKGLINQLVEHKAERLERFEENGGYSISKRDLSLIAKLSGLRTLILPYESLTRDILIEFASLKKLEELSFHCSKVSQSAILYLFVDCPKLSRLGVYGLPKPQHELMLKIGAQVRQEKARNDMHRKLPIKLNIDTDNWKIKRSIPNNHDAVFDDVQLNSDYRYYEEDYMEEEYLSDDGWESEYTLSWVTCS